MVRTAKLRWRQCSLQSLFVLTALACAALSLHVARRQARERYLVRTVISFNRLFDEQRYESAAALARQAHYWYACPLTDAMVEKATFACEISGQPQGTE